MEKRLSRREFLIKGAGLGLTCAGIGLLSPHSLLKAADKGPDDIYGIGFDLSPATLEAIRGGWTDLVLDQQPFLQGYLPIVQRCLTKKYQFRDYAGFECGGVEIGIKTWGGLQPPREGEPCIDLAVRNVDEAHETLSSKGVEFVKGPHDAKWGARIAVFRDPDGNTLQLTQIDWQRYLETAAPR